MMNEVEKLTNWKLVGMRANVILYGLSWMIIAAVWFSGGEEAVLDWQLIALMFGGGSTMILALWFQKYEIKVRNREFHQKYGIHASEFEENYPDEIQEDDSETKAIETVVEEYPKP